MNFRVHYNPDVHLPGGIHRQTFLAMKLIVIILFVANMGLSARGVSQITLSETNVPLEKVFREIQNQSGFDFICTYDILKRFDKISVHVRNASLRRAIDESLKGKPLTYTVIGRTVVVKPDRIGTSIVALDMNNDVSKLLFPYKNMVWDSYAKAVTEGSPLVAPPIEISGTVVDEEGNPMPNASVSVKGSNLGVTTDDRGRFSISVPNRDVTLVFSFTGFITAESRIGSNSTLNVVLKE